MQGSPRIQGAGLGASPGVIRAGAVAAPAIAGFQQAGYAAGAAARVGGGFQAASPRVVGGLGAGVAGSVRMGGRIGGYGGVAGVAKAAVAANAVGGARVIGQASPVGAVSPYGGVAASPYGGVAASPYGGAAASPYGVAPVASTGNLAQNKAVLDKISAFDRPKLFAGLKPFFDKSAGITGRLDYTKAQQFFETAAKSLLGVAGTSGLTQMEFQRFDFDGDGTLDSNEAAKLFRQRMIDLQKRLGGSAKPVPFKTPQQAGYNVIKELARGGQGAVQLARNAKLGEIALKTYNKSNANACGIEELRSEMEVMQSLERCPYIMECYEIFQDAQNFYCVNELLPGGDLEALRKNCMMNGVALTDDYFSSIFKQGVSALEYMHRHAMMHCDIKEPNIMLKNKDYRNPKVCLIDFGLSKYSSSDGLAGGTPGYRPPETNDTNVWFPRGDIFSMGVTFFQILADKVPCEKTMKAGIFTEGAMTLEDVILLVKTREPPWHLIERRYPGVMGFLPKMLAKRMSDRPRAPALCNDPWFASVAGARMPVTGFIMPSSVAF